MTTSRALRRRGREADTHAWAGSPGVAQAQGGGDGGLFLRGGGRGGGRGVVRVGARARGVGLGRGVAGGIEGGAAWRDGGGIVIVVVGALAVADLALLGAEADGLGLALGFGLGGRGVLGTTGGAGW